MPKRAVLAAILLLTMSACGQNTSDSASTTPDANAAAGTEAACTKVDAPMLDVDPKSDTEPVVRIPQPPDWERFTEMDSDMLRAALVNKSLTADGFTPNAVYALDRIPGDIDPQKALSTGLEVLEQMGGATDLKVTDTTVCGLPAHTVHYLLAVPGSATPQPIMLRAAVLQSGGNTYVVSLTVQSRQPDNPTYQHDSTMILDGLQVLAPQA